MARGERARARRGGATPPRCSRSACALPLPAHPSPPRHAYRGTLLTLYGFLLGGIIDCMGESASSTAWVMQLAWPRGMPIERQPPRPRPNA